PCCRCQRFPRSIRVRSARSFKVFSKGLISIGGFCFYRPVGGFSRVKSRGAFYMTWGRDSKVKIAAKSAFYAFLFAWGDASRTTAPTAGPTEGLQPLRDCIHRPLIRHDFPRA